MTRKISWREIISIFLCMLLITGLIPPGNAYAAKKIIGLVSEQEYLNKYTNKDDFIAVPYYRYATRSKETTVSGYSSLSGWTQSGKKLISSSTGKWSRSSGTAGTSSNSSYETVTKVSKTTGYEYYVWVCNHKTWFWKNNGATHNNGNCRSKNKLVIYSSRGTIGSKDSDGSYTAPKSFSTSNPGKFSTIYGMTWNGSAINSWSSGSSITPVWRGSYVTYYKTTVEKYQYSYWKWGNWSSWSDWTPNTRATGDTCKKDSTVMYYITDIRKEKQTISGKSSYSVECGDDGFNLDCTTNGDSVLNYSSSNSNVVSVSSSGYVTIRGAGSATITVKAPMTEDYYAAEKTIQITVSKKNQSVSGTRSYRVTCGDSDFYLDAEAETSLSYSSSDTDVVSVYEGGLVTINRSGSATILVTAEETDIYNSDSMEVDIYVSKASQTISLRDSYNVELGDSAFYLNAESETGEFRYSSSNQSVAVVSADGRVTIKNPGKTRITVTAVSNPYYSQAKRTVYINVKLKKPGLRLERTSGKNAHLNWHKTDGADGYKVYVYNKSKHKYVCHKTVTGNKSSAVVRVGSNSGKYNVKIRAYKNVDGRKVYSSYSNVVKATVVKVNIPHETWS